jgi:MFS family permease
MKRGLKYLLLMDGWATLALGMLGPIYAIFVFQIGGDILDASWAYFAFLISSGIAMYLISHWEDKIKKKERLVTAGYVLMAIGCLSYFFVYNQTTLIITQIILGLSEAVLVPAYDALYSKYLDKGKEASEWGNWESMGYFVSAISVVVGGYIAYTLGFKTLFIVMFVIALVSVASSLTLYKKKKYLNSR